MGKNRKRKPAPKRPGLSVNKLLLEWGGNALRGIDNKDHAAIVLALMSAAGVIDQIPVREGRKHVAQIVRHTAGSLRVLGFDARPVTVAVAAVNSRHQLLGTIGSLAPTVGGDTWNGYQVVYVPDMGVVFDPMIGVAAFHDTRVTRYPLLARIEEEPVHGTEFVMVAGRDMILTYAVTDAGVTPQSDSDINAGFQVVDANIAVISAHLKTVYAGLCEDIEKRASASLLAPVSVPDVSY